MKTILILESDARQRASLAAALLEEYLVAAVGSVHEAISFLKQHQADGVILEMSEASGDGIAVLSHVAGIRPRPQVVVLAALDEPAKAVKVIKLGVDEYLPKPCDPRALRAVIHRVLADRTDDDSAPELALRP